MGSRLAVIVRLSTVVVILSAGVAAGVGCRESSNRHSVILNRGSDTMINVAQGWAEAYAEVAPEVSVEVAGGGSGVGIAALIDGTVHIANSSRPLKADEIEKARAHHGVDPVEIVAGYDALAVFVHRDNPVQQLTLAQIQAIYAEDGAALRWSDLGVVNRACARDTIVRLSRQSSSGTYDFFREVALGRNDFKLGTLELNGSKEVVELVSHTPCAIGYSGMGYAIAGVRMVPIASNETSPAIAPSAIAALDRSYPIARPLYVFTVGKLDHETARYIEWILSDAGQRIVAKVGYVPLRLALDKS
jgi:phosphate transport system substrate-binding protein